MKRGARILLAAIALTVPSTAVAQQEAMNRLTLADAVDIARVNNPLLRQTANDIAGTTWGVRNAYASFLPTLSLSGGIGYTGAGSQFFLTSQFVQPSATIGSSYRVGLSLFLSGRTLMQPGLASAQHRAAEAALSGTEVNLESVIRQQYLAILQAEAQAELADLQVTRNDEFLRLAQARFEVGQNTLLDVRQAEVAKGQSEVTLLQARQLVIVDKLRLYQTMGIPAPEPSTIMLTDTFPVMEPAWDHEDLLAEADLSNPDLIFLRANSSAARAGERAVKSEWLPSLSFSAGWSGFTQQFTNSDVAANNAVANAQASADASVLQCDFSNSNWLNPGLTPVDCSQFALSPEAEAEIRQRTIDQNSVFPWNFTSQPFSASMGISLPIFTQFSRPLRIAEASAAADDANEAVRARELQVRTDVSQAYYALQASYEAIGIQGNNQAAAAEQLRLATERYRVGSGTFFELLDAQLAAQTAEADYINAIYAYHQSIATLEDAVGRPLR
jgi:outer membrane protein